MSMTSRSKATAAAAGAARAWLVAGANTDVGKTVVSCGLIRAACARLGGDSVHYIKPLQTGSDEGHSDERSVRRAAGAALRTRTLFDWGPAVSPHVAAQEEAAREGGRRPPEDEQVLAAVRAALAEAGGDGEPCLQIVETAGGVLSPGPAMTPQADMYRDLGLPVLLVGDGRLGGISVTLAALEALEARSYRVAALALVDSEGGRYGNAEYLRRLPIPLVTLGELPPPDVPLEGWHEAQAGRFQEMLDILLRDQERSEA